MRKSLASELVSDKRGAIYNCDREVLALPTEIKGWGNGYERTIEDVYAAVAQSVERRLGKAEVTGPIPVSSSK